MIQPRSPPGSWRLLAPALISWAVTAAALNQPGAAPFIGGVSAIVGVLLLSLMLVGGEERGGRRCRFVWFGMICRDLRKWCGVVLILAAMLTAIGSKVGVMEGARYDPLLSGPASLGSAVTFSATLSGYVETQQSDYGERSWARAVVKTPSGAAPVLLWLNETASAYSGWGTGQRIEVRGRPKALGPSDQAGYSVTVLEIRAADSQTFVASLGAVASELRTGLTDRAARFGGAELVPGFAVGDTSLVDEALETAMLETSLTHVIAVSGSNTALVTNAVTWLVALLGAGRRLRILVAAIGLMGFVFVVGPDASVQRAAVMAAVLLGSRFGGKRATALPSLGIAVIGLLLLDPWQALQAGFSLSVAATGGILLAATPLSEWLRRRTRAPGWLALPVAVALTAQLACGPLLLLLQPGIPAIGVIANVLAAVAVPLGTGIGLIGLLLGPIAHGLADAAVWVASFAASWVAATAKVCAELPFARWNWPQGWAGALLLAGCESALLFALALQRGWLSFPGSLRRHRRRPWHNDSEIPSGLRTVISVLTAGAAGMIVSLVAATPLAHRAATPRDWAVVACDVGQGDALLLRDPTRPDQVLLVDTGDDADLLRACLKRFGVQRISLLVLTHDDANHVGALSEVITDIEAALIAPTVRGERTDTRAVVRQLQVAGVPYQIAVAGDTRSSPDKLGLSWRVLAPAAVTSPSTAPSDTNAASIVMTVEAGGVRTLLLADTGEAEQARLLRSGEDLRADVLKVAHHGSRDQAVALPAAVMAEWGLISVGSGNSYGHPTADTLAALDRVGTRTLRTDLHGSIALVSAADGELAAWVESGQ